MESCQHFQSLITRLTQEHGLDLAACEAHLWLLFPPPDSNRRIER